MATATAASSTSTTNPRGTTSKGRKDRNGYTALRKSAEGRRLEEADRGVTPWRLWGPYLSERQWGTVREDYSEHGTAWDYFPHDHARSRAYRWGEDGIAGYCDEEQKLCWSVALWNGRDPILKERLFGLTNSEGNHGEDVKELYSYIDGTPTAAYLKMIYKYPQAEYPYARLVEENRRRGPHDPEFELIDSGVFDDNRYFDVAVEYFKAAPDDTLQAIAVTNRGPQAERIRVLSQIWFRNTWSWSEEADRPELSLQSDGSIAVVRGPMTGARLYADAPVESLFCENDTNTIRLFGTGDPGRSYKDGINDYVVHGRRDAVRDDGRGTKAAFLFDIEVAAGETRTLRLRLAPAADPKPFSQWEQVVRQRMAETEEFYSLLQSKCACPDRRMIQRQALAGMIWSKQFFYYDVPDWIDGDDGQPDPPSGRRQGRNREWRHLNNADVISMPDKWEYPWYAAWDLAFHTIPLAMVDPGFAKQQLVLLTREWYMHPNGQLPAYEWAFGDVNPPVHAWATWRVYQIDRNWRGGEGDTEFLERVFHKLMLNFTWWVNRKDAQGRNIFQGGFLGLDNIGVFDRSAPLPTGGFINQSDGTSWMAMYCLNLMRIALELALTNRVYEDIATKFFEHFLHIAEAMNNIGDEGIGLWDDEEKFFFDVLNLPGNRTVPLKIRSMVGLIPLFAVETLEPELLERLPDFSRRLKWFLNYRPDLANLVSHWTVPGSGDRRLLSLLRGHRMKCLLRRMLDESEFLSPYGIRAVSRFHDQNPYVFNHEGREFNVKYLPGESDSGLFGGNSNWRGPIWFPVNYLLIESLQKFHHYYGDDFKVECPTSSGRFVTLLEAAEEISDRLTSIFLEDNQGQRPVFGGHPQFNGDAHFRNLIPFHEYFHGDSGRGVGASHQTGWTGLIAKLIQPRHKD